MKIETRALTAIKPYEKNPRLNDSAVEAVANSIREFGFRQPIVVDAEGVIVCGHTRWKAAQRLGLEEVPVHVATDLTPAEARAYRIADNKTADFALWWDAAAMLDRAFEIASALGAPEDAIQELDRPRQRLAKWAEEAP